MEAVCVSVNTIAVDKYCRFVQGVANRKRALPEENGHAYLALVDTAIRTSAPVAHQDQEVAVKDPHINVVGSQVVFSNRANSNKPSNKLAKAELLRVELDEDQLKVFANHLKMLTIQPTRSGNFIRVETDPLVLKFQHGVLHAHFHYRISVIESISPIMPKNIRQKIDLVLNIAPHTASESHIDSKYFYDLITKTTQNLSLVNKIPIVAELNTDLLKFQGETLQWLLQKENNLYVFEKHASVKIPFWEQGNESELSDDQIRTKIDYISFGFELIPHLDQSIWYNKYTGNICSRSQMIKYLSEIQDYRGGSGLLSEEMGLGKTVEIISLILLNQRPTEELNQQYFDPSRERLVTKIKSTLIICPNSILYQWSDEISLHSPNLSVFIYEGVGKFKQPPTEVAQMLSTYDVVLVSFQTISREVHHAHFKQRPKRQRTTTSSTKSYKLTTTAKKNNFEIDFDNLVLLPEQTEILTEMVQDSKDSEVSSQQIDYSSPLVLVNFWRVIVDEAQLMGKTLSNACQIATMIPRYHSWAVSGTPIRNNIQDLNSLLSFLQIHPFNSNNALFDVLLKTPDDFNRLFGRLTLRHTKQMVADDITIPNQEKILLTIPFGPVELDNYQELFKNFLQEVGLNEKGEPMVEGWEPSMSYYSSMRKWLVRLRRICCHANIGKDSTDNQNLLQTIDQVLENLIVNLKDQIIGYERQKISANLLIGQVFEKVKRTDEALYIWEKQRDQIETKIQSLSKNDYVSLRSFKSLLHSAYFFIASGYFQKYSKPLENLIANVNLTMKQLEYKLQMGNLDPQLSSHIPWNSGIYSQSVKGNEERDVLIDSIKRLQEAKEIVEQNVDLDEGLVYYRVLNEEEQQFQNLENEFYSKAQLIRKELLSEPIKNVEKQILKLPKSFKLATIKINSNDISFNISLPSHFYVKFSNVVDEINSQSRVLNNWCIELLDLISEPLLDSVTEPSGEEYEKSLIAQERVPIFLDLLQKAILDRGLLINGKDSEDKIPKNDVNFGDEDDSPVRKAIESQYPSLNLTNSLRLLIVESKSVLLNLQSYSNTEVDDFSKLILILKNSFEQSKEELSTFKKFFRSLNDCYNSRINYFKQLQELSDNVQELQEVIESSEEADNKVSRILYDLNAVETKLQSSMSRLRYLQSLAAHHQRDNENLCVICRGTITIGSLTKCGHHYCKSCLNEWLKTHCKCPMCKEKVIKDEIYNFTLKHERLQFKMISNSNESNEVSQIYTQLDKSTIDKINSQQTRKNYGTKVNIIVKQLLWLKRENPTVQVVIFSQWPQLLSIIGSALTENGISFLGSKNSLDKLGGGRRSTLQTDITLFKKNPTITCFLLNAKAEASGLTLINATHVFLCEPLVNTALESQAISRVHRIGQTKPTTVWTFAVAGTVEESIMLMTTRKKLDKNENLQVEDFNQTTKSLVEKNGEFVKDDDLWSSFFSASLASTTA